MDDSVANNVPVSLKFYFEILLASLGVLPFVRGEFKNYICSRDLKIRTASQWTGATCMEANINLRVRAEVHLHQFGCNLAVLAGEAFNRFVSSGSCSAERLLNTCHCSTDFIQIGLNRYIENSQGASLKKRTHQQRWHRTDMRFDAGHAALHILCLASAFHVFKRGEVCLKSHRET